VRCCARRRRRSGVAQARTIARLRPEACVYGLGECANGLNLSPESYRLWNRDAGGTYGSGADPLYVCMPVYLYVDEAESYLIFYDNSHDGVVRLGS